MTIFVSATNCGAKKLKFFHLKSVGENSKTVRICCSSKELLLFQVESLAKEHTRKKIPTRNGAIGLSHFRSKPEKTKPGHKGNLVPIEAPKNKVPSIGHPCFSRNPRNRKVEERFSRKICISSESMKRLTMLV